MNAQQIWQAALGRLQIELSRPAFDTWVKDAHAVSFEDGMMVVGVPNPYAKDWLENSLYGTILRAVTTVAKRTVSVRFVVQLNHQSDGDKVSLLDGPPSAEPQATYNHGWVSESHITPRYTFDNFIVGQANRLAHAGCLAVAEKPGESYNPLFVYGGVGLGKTHLLHAVGNHVLVSGKRALYVSAETFANELIDAIRVHTTDEFRAKYRTIEVLLVDDVQFLINKERTQEEFFHTFNDLYQDDRQIILSSDRPPRAFVGLEERLRSRFDWGLSADVQPPDLETRMAIVATKAEEMQVRLGAEVIEFLAQQIQSNIRELEGALNRFVATARMLELPYNVQTAEQALSSMLLPPAAMTMDAILEVVSEHFGVSVQDLTGRRRTRNIALPRQIAMYLARGLTDLSLPRVGQALGGRDHTTVMYGCDKIAALFEKDDSLRREILEIKTELYRNRHRV